MQSHEESSSSLCENPASDYRLHEMRCFHKTRDPRWRHFITVCADSTRALLFFPDDDGLLKLHDPAPAIILDLSMLNLSLSRWHHAFKIGRQRRESLSLRVSRNSCPTFLESSFTTRFKHMQPMWPTGTHLYTVSSVKGGDELMIRGQIACGNPKEAERCIFWRKAAALLLP